MDQPTPRHHIIEVPPSDFTKIVDGSQPFVICPEDPEFQEEDFLVIKEYVGPLEEKKPSGNKFSTMITCIKRHDALASSGEVVIGLFYPPSVPNLTGRQIQELVLNSLAVAIQGAKSEYHQACGAIVVFYLPYVANELKEDPANLLEQYIRQIRTQQAKAGLLAVPYDKSFYNHCLESWSR